MDASLNVLKKELEEIGMKRVLEINKKKPNSMDDYINIMKQGEEEFIKKTGRHMTYAEIREIYG